MPPTLYRITRVTDPLRFSGIDPSDALLPSSGNRFDVPDGAVLYCATDSTGCYAETLARFRPSATVRAAVADAEPGFMVCGGIPADWREQRVGVQVAIDDALPFLNVEHQATHEYLTTALAVEMVALNLPVIDVGVVRGSNRLATRAIASWAYDARDTDGNPRYSGIRYMSRLGDYECWAVFSGTNIRVAHREPIELSNPALQRVAKSWGLNPF